MWIFIVHALWIKIQLTVDSTVAPWEAFFSFVFSQELQLGAWPIWLLPLRWEQCKGRDDVRAAGLALVGGPNIVGSGWQAKPKTL